MIIGTPFPCIGMQVSVTKMKVLIGKYIIFIYTTTLNHTNIRSSHEARFKWPFKIFRRMLFGYPETRTRISWILMPWIPEDFLVSQTDTWVRWMSAFFGCCRLVFNLLVSIPRYHKIAPVLFTDSLSLKVRIINSTIT